MDFLRWVRHGEEEPLAIGSRSSWTDAMSASLSAPTVLAAQSRVGPNPDTPRLLVAVFASSDRASGVQAADARSLDEKEMKRLQAILRSCWRTLDAAVKTAEGKTLRSGPRGGGRDAAA